MVMVIMCHVDIVGLVSLFLVLCVKSYPVVNPTQSLTYLTRFGYLKPELREAIEVHSATAREKIQEGLRNFQYFAGIPQTGFLDKPTLQRMNFPRCGNSELEKKKLTKRNKRYVLDSRWEKVYLTYGLKNTPSNGPNRTAIEAVLRDAFSFWTKEANIHIQPIKNPIQIPDILISFVPKEHGDGVSFDEIEGVGRVIAHAWKPYNEEGLRGDMHFSDALNWTIGTTTQIDTYDLLQTTIHEAGHALGLEHSPHPDAVMYFAMTEYRKDNSLSPDDKAAIKELYGSPLGGSGDKIQKKNGRPIVVPSGTPGDNVPWECYRLHEQKPWDAEGVKRCYQAFYKDFYRSQG